MLYVGLVFAVGFAALGRWVYRHPERFLDKFNPFIKPYSNLALRFTRSVGVLWLFVAIYGFFAFLGQLIGQAVPAIILTVIFLVLSILTTWLLAKQSSA